MNVDRVLRAIANARRLQILAKLRVSQPTVSEHLKILSQAGLIRGKRGSWRAFDTRDRAMTRQSQEFLVRPIRPADYAGWRPLWDAYNRFYGRDGVTALAENITAATWERFFAPEEPVHALVAEEGGRIIGITHYLFHRSTTRLTDVCYLQDLFTAEELRGRGVGRQLISAVYDAARADGSSRVYWQTHVTNAAGRALYDKLAKHQGFIVYTHDL